MSFDSILVFATLLVTIYMVLPEYKRLELKLRWSLIDSLFLLLGMVLVHYLLFYSTFNKLGISPHLNLNKYNLNPKNASYLVILATVLFIYASISTFRFSRSKVYKYKFLVDELLIEKRYSDLVKLLHGRLLCLKRIAASDYFLPNLRRKWRKKALWEMVVQIREGNRSPNKFQEKISQYLPEYKKSQTAGSDTINCFLMSEEFTDYVAIYRPYFGVEILGSDLPQVDHFLDNFFHALLRNTSSTFYVEIKNNQNMGRGHSYVIPDENIILKYLFHDARVAEKLSVYRPVGEYIICYLDELYRNRETDTYNYPQEDDFSEKRRWESPLFAGIHFFDVMVSAALHQNIQWHMWLYYFPHFVKRIVRNYSPAEGYVDFDREFPTKYEYLLYEIVSTLRNWIREVEYIPSDQSNIILESVSATHENDNIPKSSILALGQCLYEIVDSSKLATRFTNDTIHLTYNLYFDLICKETTSSYAKVLIVSLLQGGFHRYENIDNYHEALIEAWASFDKIPYEYAKIIEFEKFLLNSKNR